MKRFSMLTAAAAIFVAGATVFACTVENDNTPAPVAGTGGSTEGGVGGSAGTAGAAGTGGSQACSKITVKEIERDPYSDDTGATLYGTPDPALGGSDPDEWDLQLYEANGSQAPGTFNLGTGNDANFKTCDHCVVVWQDVTQDTVGKTFFQQSGELTMTVNGSPMTGKVKGSLKNVKLIEVTVDANDYTSTPVANGACLEIDTLDFDTTLPVADAGTPCEVATDCGDTDVMICDPATKGCQPVQCSASKECATGSTCYGQSGNSSVGACYTDCQYPSTTCGTGACEVGIAGTTGRCLSVGTGAADGACAPAASDLSTRCIADYTCMSEKLGDGGTVDTCRKMCDYWGTSTCASGTYCDAIGPICTDKGENVALGAGCVGDEFTACAPVGARYEGICVTSGAGDGGTAITCEKWCRVGQANDCPTGQACDPGAFYGVDAVGVCRVPPVAGWTCDFSWYGDGSWCDCNCSVWDKDCDDSTAGQSDCTDPQVCTAAGKPGTCGTAKDAAAE
jgi:hypothetical protein